MKLGIPQIIFIILLSYNLLTNLSRHGETKKVEKYNFFTTAIAFAISLYLLYWGGFFK